MFKIKPMNFNFLTSSPAPRKCSSPGCEKTFIPNKSNQIYCCKKCRDYAFRRKYGPGGKPTRIVGGPADDAVAAACKEALLHSGTAPAAPPEPPSSAEPPSSNPTEATYKTLDILHPITPATPSTVPSTAEEDLFARWTKESQEQEQSSRGADSDTPESHIFVVKEE